MLKFNFFQLKFVSGGALGGALKTSSGGALFKKSQKWGGTKKSAPPLPPRCPPTWETLLAHVSISETHVSISENTYKGVGYSQVPNIREGT